MPDEPVDQPAGRSRAEPDGRAAWALTVLGGWLVAAAGVLIATGRIDDARPLAVLAGIGLLVGALASLVVRRRWLWPLAAVVVAGTVGELWSVAGRLPPRPFHPATYPLLVPAWSLCLAVVGVALVTVGRLRGAAAERAHDRDRFRVGVRLSSPVVAAALAVLAGVVLVPFQVRAANTDATTSDGPLPRSHSPVLTGQVAWQARDVVADTAAGPVVVTGDGIGVVDPSTGALRWQYRRSDVTYRSPLLDADPVVTSVDGRLLVAQPESDESTAPLQVFDTRTGRLLHEVDAGSGDVLAITSRLVLLAREARPGTLAAYTLEGDHVWTAHLDASCERPTSVEQNARRVVLDACGSLFAVDVRTGRRLWHRDPPPGRVLDAVVAPSGAGQILARVRRSGERRDGAVTGYVAVDTADGDVAWRIPRSGHGGRLTICDSAAATVDVVVIGVCHDSGRHGPDHGFVTAYRAATGQVLWRRAVTRPSLDDYDEPVLPLAALADGRVVIGYGTYLRGDQRCPLTVVDRDGQHPRSIHVVPYHHFCPERLIPMRGLLLASQPEPYDPAMALR